MNIRQSDLTTCCFTGHRPDKINLSESQVKSLLDKAVDTVISEGYDTFITGMASGTDIWAAEIIIKRKKLNPNLHLICALPYPKFNKSKKSPVNTRFLQIIDNADAVKEICGHYHKGCYQIRNKWMVDHSNTVIAVFDGQKGGTKNTVDYAMKKNLRVINVLTNTLI